MENIMEKTINEWKAWIEKNGRMPSKSSSDFAERTLKGRMNYYWNQMNKDKEQYADYIKEYIEIYTKYSNRLPSNVPWYQTFDEWKTWSLTHGRTASKTSSDDYERKLAERIHNYFSKLKKSPDKYVTQFPEYSRIYKSLNKRPPTNVPCIETFNKWKKFCITNERIPLETSNDETEVLLCHQMRRSLIRIKENKDKYSKELVEYYNILALYDALPVSPCSNEVTFEEWKTWTLTYGDTPKRHSKDAVENKLAARMSYVVSKCRKTPEKYADLLQEYDEIYTKYNKKDSVKKTKLETLEEWKKWCDTQKKLPKPTSSDSCESKLYARMNRCVVRMRKKSKIYSDLLAEYEKYHNKYKERRKSVNCIPIVQTSK